MTTTATTATADDEISSKIIKLQEATDLAHQQLLICQETYSKACDELDAAKSKYKSISDEEQANTQINDTELPELIETKLRAKNVLETTQTRYETNLRYLNTFKQQQK